MTAPLILHAAPAAGFDQPFEMLQACHQRVERMLALLERLGRHGMTVGCDTDARQAARDVMRYFDLAGPAHHEDEERHLFPRLAAQGQPALTALVQRLGEEHGRMVSQWREVRADLTAVANGDWPAGEAATAALARWAAFARLYRDHIVLEEAQAYPASESLLDAAAQAAMGQEMAERRGARRLLP